MGKRKNIMDKVLTAFLTSLLLTLVLYGATPALAATSPTLGTVESYSILAGSIVTNTGATTMPGNLGISPGIGVTPHYTGFPPGLVGPPGTIHDADSNAAAAQAADTAAFGALSAPPNVACDTNYGAVTKDLVGLTLVPGVYCADAFALSGTLTLDDTGNANGVWIFRSELSTLITSPGGVAKVQFLNEIGSSCNVWWKVASSATLETGTTFIGNILALTSISLKTGATLDGRALAQTGAVTLEGNTITASACSEQTPPEADIADISGMKFNDSNNNHIKDVGEEGLAGWTITLSKPVSGTTITDITDSSGKYNFTGLPPGTYIVSETQQGGWTQTTPVSPGTHSIVLNGVDVTDKDFGNFKKSTPPLPPPPVPEFSTLILLSTGILGLLLLVGRKRKD